MDSGIYRIEQNPEYGISERMVKPLILSVLHNGCYDLLGKRNLNGLHQIRDAEMAEIDLESFKDNGLLERTIRRIEGLKVDFRLDKKV